LSFSPIRICDVWNLRQAYRAARRAWLRDRFLARATVVKMQACKPKTLQIATNILAAMFFIA
jgi:hypothetical protein